MDFSCCLRPLPPVLSPVDRRGEGAGDGGRCTLRSRGNDLLMTRSNRERSGYPFDSVRGRRRGNPFIEIIVSRPPGPFHLVSRAGPTYSSQSEGSTLSIGLGPDKTHLCSCFVEDGGFSESPRVSPQSRRPPPPILVP